MKHEQKTSNGGRLESKKSVNKARKQRRLLRKHDHKAIARMFGVAA